MKKGFTLVELLVALSIMALIMAASMTAFEATKKSARDGKRKSDLEGGIRSSLEVYRFDKGGYPQVLDTLKTTGYFSDIPKDPNGTSYGYNVTGCTTTNGLTICSRYYLCSTLEITPNPVPDVTNCGDSCGTGGCKYITTNP